MAKPQKKSEVAVVFVGKKEGVIHLVASDEAMGEFFDYFYDVKRGDGDFYNVHVDPRYDLEAVVDYVESWKSEND